MMGIGPFEILMVLVVALILVGPERMPELVRFAARMLREIRAAAGEMRQQVEQLAQAEELRAEVETVKNTIAQADVREDLRLQTDAPPSAASPPPTPASPAPTPEEEASTRE